MTTVVHIITGLGSGGAERILFQVASRNASAPDMRQVVVSLMDDGIYGDELRIAGVEVECLHMRPSQPSFAAFLRLVKLLSRLQPDVIMTWLYHADLLGTLAARSVGVRRVIWNIRCSDLDFSRYSPFTRWLVTLLARMSRLPWAVATNSHVGQRAHEALGYTPKRWIYLPNGFDTEMWKPDAADRLSARRELGFSDSDIVIGMVGRKDPQKDHASFFEAVKTIIPKQPNLRLLLIGKKTQELPIPDQLRRCAVVLGERQKVPHLMRAIDVLVSCSAYGEGFPNVIGEAMSSGIPCVVTDVGDSALIVGDTGKIVPPSAPQALAAAIEDMIDRPRDDFDALSARARERIKSTYSIMQCLRRYDDLFRSVSSNDSKTWYLKEPAK
jgi:glycosyltransferase involved in cell wall biosynthesis